MRINPKIYRAIDSAEPFETQEFDGRKIELYFMNGFDGIQEEFIGKGQFAVWTSDDGFNYRMLIEEGYYNVVGELYSQDINKIWVEFWDKTDAISKKFTRFFMIPMMIIVVAVVIICNFLGNIGSYISIGVLIASFIAMLFINTRTKKAIMQENVNSRKMIVEKIGQEHFDKLLEAQKEYMDEYYDKLYPSEEEDEENSDDSENSIEENAIAEEELENADSNENKEELEESNVVDEALEAVENTDSEENEKKEE